MNKKKGLPVLLALFRRGESPKGKGHQGKKKPTKNPQNKKPHLLYCVLSYTMLLKAQQDGKWTVCNATFVYAAALSPCPVPIASHAANRKQLDARTLLGYISKFT